MTDVKFNLNRWVRVRLTNSGKAELKRQHAELWSCTKRRDPPRYVPPVEDEDGWSRWQFWDLISSLGHTMCPGTPNGFEMEIVLEVE